MLNGVLNFLKKAGLRVDVETTTTPKTVWVGMSGGVDSAVSAYLLKQQGYDVTGVFIKVWQPDNTECNWKDDRRDAMRVCAEIGIPFKTLDLSHEYKSKVVEYMISEYSKGRTPNPDIMCNRHIKFGGFLDLAIKNNIDFVATGHYANVEEIKGTSGQIRSMLVEGADKNKDQSYFLWTLTSRDLDRVLFPVGELLKPEVRKIAEDNKLSVFDKKDSQGVCFIGHVDMKDFLKKHVKTTPGKVLDTEGQEIGEHDGSILYTLGERIGFKPYQSGSNDKPMYVFAKDVQKNTISVTEKNLLSSSNLETTANVTPLSNTSGGSVEAILTNLNWNSIDLSPGTKIEARVRYRQERQVCTFDIKTSLIKFEKPQVLAPGQSIVFYTGERCLGGGIIA